MRARAFPRCIISLALPLLAASCAVPGFVRDPGPWVDAANWASASRARVTITQYALDPQVLSFKEGKAYVLDIVNESGTAREVVSGHFFRAIATLKGEVPKSAYLRAPYFTEIELQPKATVELFFVAVRPGTYEIVCSVPGSNEPGMIGAFQIVPASPAGSK